jgi:hypothetical protein
VVGVPGVIRSVGRASNLAARGRGPAGRGRRVAETGSATSHGSSCIIQTTPSGRNLEVNFPGEQSKRPTLKNVVFCFLVWQRDSQSRRRPENSIFFDIVVLEFASGHLLTLALGVIERYPRSATSVDIFCDSCNAMDVFIFLARSHPTAPGRQTNQPKHHL